MGTSRQDRHLRRRHRRRRGGLLSRRRARPRERDDRRAGQSALAHLGQIDRGLPQLVARPRSGHDRLHEPQHRPDGGDRARNRQPHQSQPPRLRVRDRRSGQDRVAATKWRETPRRAAAARRGSTTRASSAYTPSPERGFDFPLTGADVITDTSLIRRHFPYLTPETVAVAHARRAGWLSAQQLGMTMLEAARERGVQAHARQGGRRRHRRRAGARPFRSSSRASGTRSKRRISCSPRGRCRRRWPG